MNCKKCNGQGSVIVEKDLVRLCDCKFNPYKQLIELKEENRKLKECKETTYSLQEQLTILRNKYNIKEELIRSFLSEPFSDAEYKKYGREIFVKMIEEAE